MDGLLSNYMERLDLLFVFANKEVKHGDLDAALALFRREQTGKLVQEVVSYRARVRNI